MSICIEIIIKIKIITLSISSDVDHVVRLFHVPAMNNITVYTDR